MQRTDRLVQRVQEVGVASPLEMLMGMNIRIVDRVLVGALVGTGSASHAALEYGIVGLGPGSTS